MPAVLSVPLTERNIFDVNQIGRTNKHNFSLEYKDILTSIECLVNTIDKEGKKKKQNIQKSRKNW